MNKELHEIPFEVTEKGSLGLLAGDLGLRAWRKVRNASYQKQEDEEKK
ncbi:hypothetical protein [Lacinutrix undariae]